MGEVAPDAMRPTPIAILYTEYLAFVVADASSLKTGADMLSLMGDEKRPKTIAIATSLGNPNHIALAEIADHGGNDIQAAEISVFTSARHAVASVTDGEADFGVVTAASAIPEMQSGAVRTLAVSAPERLGPPFSDTPT